MKIFPADLAGSQIRDYLVRKSTAYTFMSPNSTALYTLLDFNNLLLVY